MVALEGRRDDHNTDDFALDRTVSLSLIAVHCQKAQLLIRLEEEVEEG